MDRSAWAWIAGLIGLVVVAGVIVAVRQPASFPVDTPEGVVQRYLQDVFDGDASAAEGWWADDVPEDCRFFLEDQLRYGSPWEDRAALRDVRISGDTAEVVVELFHSGGVFETASGRKVTFDLVRTDGGWRIMGNPWPVEWCRQEPYPEG